LGVIWLASAYSKSGMNIARVSVGNVLLIDAIA
jgi:hypothetical protein